MTAKLARVKEQELLLMQTWGAADPQVQEDKKQLLPKKKKKKSSKNKDVHAVMCAVEPEPENGSKTAKKQKSKRDGVLEQDEGKDDCLSVEHKQETYEPKHLKKKRKKHDKTKVTDACNSELCIITTQKKKKKKKEKIEMSL